MNWIGLVAGAAMIVLTGLGHVMVIKGEYYFGTKLWYLFLIGGMLCLGASLIVTNAFVSVVLGIAAATLLVGHPRAVPSEEEVKKDTIQKSEEDLIVC